MVWYGMVWYGMVWYGMVWYGVVWYGMVWYDDAQDGQLLPTDMAAHRLGVGVDRDAFDCMPCSLSLQGIMTAICVPGG